MVVGLKAVVAAELKAAAVELKVVAAELKVAVAELKMAAAELKVTAEELKVAAAELKVVAAAELQVVAAAELKVAAAELKVVAAAELKVVVAAKRKVAAAELQVVAAAECLTEECGVEEHLKGPTVEWSHWQVVVKLIVIVSANVSHCEGPCVPVEAPNVLLAPGSAAKGSPLGQAALLAVHPAPMDDGLVSVWMKAAVVGLTAAVEKYRWGLKTKPLLEENLLEESLLEESLLEESLLEESLLEESLLD